MLFRRSNHELPDEWPEYSERQDPADVLKDSQDHRPRQMRVCLSEAALRLPIGRGGVIQFSAISGRIIVVRLEVCDGNLYAVRSNLGGPNRTRAWAGNYT